ncbi:HsdM family class I SAM-dependent methyltransferase [Kosmotoga pacifica]|uniref:site-specific DNA-methyltransferase (adenine-specific) n=1 Tax=Kosmotoga pacifica TaxID=1330330 RepID=A0A0G2ZGW7_9BACT|nr:SAM-dependent methyltransferase [Kosmotoga pacifica]AKI97993.1 hypothetical protein IX53_09330 [Kosmotoga pacifica]
MNESIVDKNQLCSLGTRILEFLEHNAIDYEHFKDACKHPLLVSFLSNTVKTKPVDRKINSNFFEFFDSFWLQKKKRDKKSLGIEFTPKKLADYIVSLTIGNNFNYEKILDPATGTGIFLRSTLEYLVRKYNIPAKEVIEKYLIGLDIVEEFVTATQLSLLLKAYQLGSKISYINVDSVFAGDILNADINNFFYVVGNPPYIKWHNLSSEQRDLVFKKSSYVSGTYNMYLVIMEYLLKKLKNEGKLGFVIPNTIFTSSSARNFRKWLKQNFEIQWIIDFEDLKLFNADSYACIVVIRKSSPSDYFNFIRANNLDELTKIESKVVRGVIKDDHGKMWHILTQREKRNIEKIENAGPSLSDICRISTGIATLKDNVYILDMKHTYGDYYYVKTHAGCIYYIEKGIVRPVKKISDKRESLGIIFPYIFNGKRYEVIDEEKMKEFFPRTLEYFYAIKDILAERDKGKRNYEIWYAYGRRQNIGVRGVKILTPTFSKKPSFFIDWNEDRLFLNGYGLIFNLNSKTTKKNTNLMLFGTKEKDISFIREKKDIEILNRILNSKVMDYYITLTSEHLAGGFKCYQKKYISKFSIPRFNLDRELLQIPSTEFEKWLWNLYGLPENELEQNT